jgi:glycosyltransferase involved in cell wall biosynthesis
VIPNWGAVDKISVLPKENPWSKKQGLEGKRVILYSGTLGLKHNPDLLAALAQKFHDQPDVRVVVAAAGVGVAQLTARKAELGLDNLLLLPIQPFEDLPHMLASADALAAVIERDAGVFSVPSKVLSYLCAGRPILLAAPGENLAAKTVLRNEAGLVVEPEDDAGWLDAAARLLGDADLRTRFGAAGRRYAEANFDVANVADRFESVFTTLQSTRSSAA